MDFMPQTKALIFDRGITFSKAYVTTPLCCPSRASILTGMYAHSHGVLTNNTILQRKTFVDRLHDNGYFTGFVGKYLNSWLGEARPEFDYWVGLPKRSEYFDPRLNINGNWQVIQGYQTTILGQHMVEFLDQAAKQSKPWLLYYAPHAPHAPALPAPEYQNLYADLPPFRPPSFNEADVSDKPFKDSLPLLTASQIEFNDQFRLQQLRTLKSVDDTVGTLFQKLEEHGMLDDTAVFFISDNGMLLGEHRLSTAKVFAYEPSIHVPFGFSYPRLVTKPQVIDKLVANIDIAPTIYNLTGIPVPPEVEGLSLVSLMKGEGQWRDALIIESWLGQDISDGDRLNTYPGLNVANPYVGIHKGRYIYIETIGGAREFYDLEVDPDQLENQVDNPAYADTLADMKAGLDYLKGPFMTTLATQMALPDLAPTPAPTP